MQKDTLLILALLFVLSQEPGHGALLAALGYLLL